jgi:hypothetical protein
MEQKHFKKIGEMANYQVNKKTTWLFKNIRLLISFEKWEQSYYILRSDT